MSTSDINRKTLEVTRTPFDNIALAFSGGGFRAAAFSLGTLSYLNELKQDNGDPLLNNVTYISSASGGTITNAVYALYSARGADFGTYYKKLVESITGVELLDEVFRVLNDNKAWKQYEYKKRNLINAFSLAYNDKLFDNAVGGDLAPEKAKGTNHLDEVCFNTTDFFRGLLFRQAIKMKPDSKKDDSFLFGNYVMNVLHHAEYDLKLGDMLAASSCFPAGFEPIVFPQDFVKDKAGLDKLHRNMHIQLQEVKQSEVDWLYKQPELNNAINALQQPINVKDAAKKLETLENDGLQQEFRAGFMDGGITDNQALESMMRANDRRMKQETSFKEFDLMMPTDVASHYMDPYIPSKKKNKYSWFQSLSINTILACCVILSIAGVATLIASICCATGSTEAILAAISAPVFILFGFIAGLIMWVRAYVSSEVGKGEGLDLRKSFSEDIVNNMFKYFGKTPIGVIIQMLADRFTSVLTLNFDVFLKRIRQILYQQFMNEGRDTFRLKTNHVYDLSFANDRNRMDNDRHGLQPLTLMQCVAQRAFEMGTTLWFDTKSTSGNVEAALIACGQFTTCYNLLEYILRMKDPAFQPSAAAQAGYATYFDMLSPDYQEKVNVLQAALTADFDAFNKDPYWLYNKQGVDYKIADFKSCSAAGSTIPKEFERLRTPNPRPGSGLKQ